MTRIDALLVIEARMPCFLDPSKNTFITQPFDPMQGLLGEASPPAPIQGNPFAEHLLKLSTHGGE